MAYKVRLGHAEMSGTLGTDDITYTEDPDTGIDFSQDTIELETGGTARLRINNDFTELSNGIKTSGIRSINANYTAQNSDYCLACVNTGAITITLPTKNNNGGQVLVIKDANGNAATHNITLDANASETIDGGPTFTLGHDFKCVTLMCDGFNGWFVLSTNG